MMLTTLVVAASLASHHGDAASCLNESTLTGSMEKVKKITSFHGSG
jgi:hypothetical protein